MSQKQKNCNVTKALIILIEISQKVLGLEFNQMYLPHPPFPPSDSQPHPFSLAINPASNLQPLPIPQHQPLPQHHPLTKTTFSTLASINVYMHKSLRNQRRTPPSSGTEVSLESLLSLTARRRPR